MFFCAQAQTPSGLILSCSKSAKSSSHHQCPLCPFAKIVFAPFSANEIAPFIFSSRKTYTPLSFDCLAKPVNIYSNFFLIYFSQFFALGFFSQYSSGVMFSWHAKHSAFIAIQHIFWDRLLIEILIGFHCRLRSSHSLAVIEFAVSKFMFFCAQAQTPSGLILSCSKSAKSSSHHQCPLCPFAKIVFAPFSANEIAPFIFSSRKT